jgi:hypothetical protein
MDPKALDTPVGRLQYQILREMFLAVAGQSVWASTISNFALATTGAYVGLLVANLDKIQPHLHKGWHGPVFVCATLSAISGILIQILSGFVQSSTGAENKLLPLLFNALLKPQEFGIDPRQVDADFPHRLVNPVIDEFINSGPWPYRHLKKWGRQRGEQDLVSVSKTAASCSQIMSLLLILQYILLGTAIFWPLWKIH